MYAYVSPIGGAPKMEHLTCFAPGMLVLGANEAPTAELADASLVSAGTVVRGARYAWERYPQCMLYDGDPEGEERGVAAAPFCFDLARNAPCAPTNPRNP